MHVTATEFRSSPSKLGVLLSFSDEGETNGARRIYQLKAEKVAVGRARFTSALCTQKAHYPKRKYGSGEEKEEGWERGEWEERLRAVLGHSSESPWVLGFCTKGICCRCAWV